ncbi:MAG: hypothetical protein OXU78_10980 [Deltaproteobacteria bacterium]|nr:hypothetical protein [Deltaproteobacteria bacterium]
MNSLRRFWEQIELANQPIGEEYMAYRMDGASDKKPDMRLEIGLGTCHSCDYFTIHGNKILLIEETCLLKSIANYREKYGSTLEEEKEGKKGNLLNRMIRDENVLKIYGSLLVLCHWAAKDRDVANSIREKKHIFWLVISDAESEGDQSRALYYADSYLIRKFKGVNLLQDVKILTPSQFKRKLKP